MICEGFVMEVAFNLNFDGWKAFCPPGTGSEHARENGKNNQSVYSKMR